MESTTIKPRGIVLSRLAAGLLLAGGALALVAVALITYTFAPCHQHDSPLDRFSIASMSSGNRINVRLPTSFIPISYKVSASENLTNDSKRTRFSCAV